MTSEKKACCTPARPTSEVAPASCCQAKKPIEVDLNASTAGMKKLEGGVFLMGNESTLAFPGDGEGPVRPVSLSPFWIDICAVSNTEFSQFVDATGYVSEAEEIGWSYVFYRDVTAKGKKRVQGRAASAQWWLGVEGADWKHPEGPGSNIRKRGEHPVVHISCRDANAYCTWADKRLPTEAEWEYASRGGLEQKAYPWGDELTPGGAHRCNIWQGKFPTFNSSADGYTATAPVRSFEPNGYGLYNMTGNVWEWTADWFTPHHSKEALKDPTGPQTGEIKVIKGGSYMCHASYCNRYRCAARTANTPDSATTHCGFRCVRDG